MPNSLMLDDDLDGVELVIAIEKAFAIKISDKEANAVLTVGDLYDLLVTKFSDGIEVGGRCMSSMTFYRLRRALREIAPGTEVKPETPLLAFPDSRLGVFRLNLGRLSGLNLPSTSGPLVWLGLALFFLGFLALLPAEWIGPSAFATAGAMMVIGLVAVKLSRTELPADCRTVGELVRRTAALNFGRLASQGGRVHRDELWSVLVVLLAEHGALPASEIGLETLILASQLKAA